MSSLSYIYSACHDRCIISCLENGRVYAAYSIVCFLMNASAESILMGKLVTDLCYIYYQA